MAGLKSVRCVDNRPFLHEHGGRLVQESRPGEFASLTIDKVYDVLSVERGWYRIIDDTDEDYLYPLNLLDALDGDD